MGDDDSVEAAKRLFAFPDWSWPPKALLFAEAAVDLDIDGSDEAVVDGTEYGVGVICPPSKNCLLMAERPTALPAAASCECEPPVVRCWSLCTRSSSSKLDNSWLPTPKCDDEPLEDGEFT